MSKRLLNIEEIREQIKKHMPPGDRDVRKELLELAEWMHDCIQKASQHPDLPPSKHPECDKIQEVKDKSHAIGEFMDWLREEKGWTVCEEHHHDDDCLDLIPRFEGDEEGDMQQICGCLEGQYISVPLRMEQLLAEFFEIDLDKVEEERQALLAEQRALNQTNYRRTR